MSSRCFYSCFGSLCRQAAHCYLTGRHNIKLWITNLPQTHWSLWKKTTTGDYNVYSGTRHCRGKLYPWEPLHSSPKAIVTVVQLPVGCPVRNTHTKTIIYCFFMSWFCNKRILHGIHDSLQNLDLTFQDVPLVSKLFHQLLVSKTRQHTVRHQLRYKYNVKGKSSAVLF